jgi:hypothetical protein
MRLMPFESTTKFLPDLRFVFGSLYFIANKLGDLSMQEPEQQEVSGSGADQLILTPARVSLITATRPDTDLMCQGSQSRVSLETTLATSGFAV